MLHRRGPPTPSQSPTCRKKGEKPFRSFVSHACETRVQRHKRFLVLGEFDSVEPLVCQIGETKNSEAGSARSFFKFPSNIYVFEQTR